ncbi:SdrH family protein [Staphylococcus shinii]|uniref:SdrH family protein n=1 Tax=Staphylococcus shinii TaxID=2912228 RepID=UPI003F83D89F
MKWYFSHKFVISSFALALSTTLVSSQTHAAEQQIDEKLTNNNTNQSDKRPIHSNPANHIKSPTTVEDTAQSDNTTNQESDNDLGETVQDNEKIQNDWDKQNTNNDGLSDVQGQQDNSNLTEQNQSNNDNSNEMNEQPNPDESNNGDGTDEQPNPNEPNNGDGTDEQPNPDEPNNGDGTDEQPNPDEPNNGDGTDKPSGGGSETPDKPGNGDNGNTQPNPDEPNNGSGSDKPSGGGSETPDKPGNGDNGNTQPNPDEPNNGSGSDKPSGGGSETPKPPNEDSDTNKPNNGNHAGPNNSNKPGNNSNLSPSKPNNQGDSNVTSNQGGNTNNNSNTNNHSINHANDNNNELQYGSSSHHEIASGGVSASYGDLAKNEKSQSNEKQLINRFDQMSSGSFKYNPFVVNQVKQLSSSAKTVTDKDISSVLRRQTFADNAFLNELQKGTNYFKFQYFNVLKSSDYYKNLDNQVLALITGEIGSMPDLKNPKRQQSSGKYEYHSSSEDELTHTTNEQSKNEIDVKFERTLFALITAMIIIFIGMVLGFIVNRKNKKDSE